MTYRIDLPTPPRFAGLPRLRPLPWPITPYGPFRAVDEDGSLEQFKTDGTKVIRWIERNCVLTKDRWRGLPFRMMPWQKQLLLDLFELVWDDELERWRRRYRTAYIGVPKKQAKTELVAALANYFLLGAGEPDPKIAAAAAADTQADLVFGAAKAMFEIEGAPLRGQAQCFTKEIQIPGQSGIWIRRIPANGGKFDGQNLLVGIGDEIHEWQTPNQRKMYGMISGAFATREEPLHLNITTAGEDEGDLDDDEVTPWLFLYRLGRRVEAGEVEDDTFFFRWWMAPVESNFRDPAVWADPSVNPSYGVTVAEAFYRSELNKRTESEFRRYYLNQPVETVNIWLEPGTWEACYVDGIALDPALDTVLGWDASTKRDSTAVWAGQWQEIEERRRLVVKRIGVWERPFKGGVPDQDWKVPKGEVITAIEDAATTYKLVGVAYDPHAISWVVESLEDRGLPMVEVPQNDAQMCPATQALYEMIIDRTLAHDGDAVLTRHIKAAKVKNTPRGGQRLVKDPNGRGRKIDAAIALVLVCYLSGVPAQPENLVLWAPAKAEA